MAPSAARPTVSPAPAVSPAEAGLASDCDTSGVPCLNVGPWPGPDGETLQPLQPLEHPEIEQHFESFDPLSGYVPNAWKRSMYPVDVRRP